MSDPLPNSVESTHLAPEYEGIFHHEGRFAPDTVIHKGSGIRSFMLRVDQGSPSGLHETYINMLGKYQSTLQTPESGFFPSGLSREQMGRVLAAQEFIFTQNGGLPNEHSMQNNIDLYEDPLELTLSNFIKQGRGALTCVESSAQTQQILSPAEKLSYISGVADLNGNGKGEPHSFNLIGVTNPQYAGAILDIANPVYETTEKGVTVKLYCAPLSEEQMSDFKQGRAITLDYGGTQRTYKYGMSLDGEENRSW